MSFKRSGVVGHYNGKGNDKCNEAEEEGDGCGRGKDEGLAGVTQDARHPQAGEDGLQPEESIVFLCHWLPC